MTFREFKGHTIEQSLAGNDYFVINPIKHKTARVGMQGLSDSQRLNCLQRCFFVKAYSFVLGLRSGLVFFPADFHQLRKVVELGQQTCGGSSSFALLSFHGKPLGAQVCHKLWVQMFLKAGKDCPGYPKRITYGLFRAQVNLIKLK